MLTALLIIVIGVLWARVGYVQLARGTAFAADAERNRVRIHYVPFLRGIIFDRNMRPLVENIPNFYVSVIPADVPKEQDAYAEYVTSLALVLDMDEQHLLEMIHLEERSVLEYF